MLRTWTLDLRYESLTSQYSILRTNFITSSHYMTDLEKFQNKRKESLFQTIFSPFWRALEDLGKAMAGSSKKSKSSKGASTSDDQISVELDKFESSKIQKIK